MTIKGRKKVAVVTGGTAGIGRAVATQLAHNGTNVIIVGRDQAKGGDVAQEISSATGNPHITFLAADLTLASEARKLAQEIASRHDHIDYLIHSAGIVLPKKQLTTEGNESVMAVQYLMRYLVTELLLSLLRAADDGRVVTISGGSRSVGRGGSLAFDNFNAEQEYSLRGRLRAVSDANLLWTVDFAQREPSLRIYNYSPGFVRTNLMRSMSGVLRLLIKIMAAFTAASPEEASAPVVALVTGDYPSGHYDKTLEVVVVPADRAPAAQREQLRTLSARLTA